MRFMPAHNRMGEPAMAKAGGASGKSGRRFASENRAWPGRREPEQQRYFGSRGRRQAKICSREAGA
ncbi:MAG TPA: hypothetical protein VHX88_03115, partial [Solirubrobacteraceae bacterium]|nr:hypothetical protein [Solirubrobacteraceae bacterium]